MKHFILLTALIFSDYCLSTEPYRVSESIIKEFQCAFKDCVKIIFPVVNKLGEDSLNVLVKLTEDLKKQQNLVKNSPGITKWQALSLELDLIRQYWLDCRLLERLHGYGYGHAHGDFNMHIILTGKNLGEGDAYNFLMAAITQKKKLEQEHCAKGSWEELCKNHIVIFEGMTKDRLMRLLALLPDKSLGSFSYFGHGDKEVLITGPKAIAVPSSWSEDLNVSYSEWRKLSLGTFYVSDTGYSLEGSNLTIGSELNRALIDSGEIKIHGCSSENMARSFGRAVPTSKSYGTSQNMKFRYQAEKGGKWNYDFDFPVPTTAFAVEMIPGDKNLADFKNQTNRRVQDKKPTTVRFGDRRDLITKDVIRRVAFAGSKSAIIEYQGKERIIYFSDYEIARIKDIFKQDGLDRALEIGAELIPWMDLGGLKRKDYELRKKQFNNEDDREIFQKLEMIFNYSEERYYKK